MSQGMTPTSGSFTPIEAECSRPDGQVGHTPVHGAPAADASPAASQPTRVADQYQIAVAASSNHGVVSDQTRFADTPERGRSQPSQPSRNQQAVAMGRQVYQESLQDGHWSNEAARYWEDVKDRNDRAVGDGQRGPVTATAVHVGATVMGFFVEMSGVRQVRARAGQLGAEVGGGADRMEIAKTGAMLAGETLLAASNGLGVGGVGRAAAVRAEGTAIVRGAEALRAGEAVTGAVLRHGDDVARAAGAAKAIRGMRGVGRGAASQVTRELQALVKELPIGQGGKISQSQARQAFKRLQAFAGRYGITLREGGRAGEAVNHGREVVVSLKAGAAHELVHAFQMVQVRAVAYADEAARLGKRIADLPPSAFDRAHQLVVKPFEHQAYAVFESMAYHATGFMGRANAATYKTAITEGLQAFGEGLAKGTVPDLASSLGARLYGDLTILGRSQAEIGDKLLMGAGAIINDRLHQ